MSFGPFESKMKNEGLSESAIAAFRHAYGELTSGTAQPIAESIIDPVASLPSLAADISGKVAIDKSLLDQSVVLKLNGGLGTSMGLDKAKSLLPVKGKDTFLDLTAKQIISMRNNLDSNVRFMLMNSFNTSTDTMTFLTKYPALGARSELEFIQNKVPKVDKSNMEPATWTINPHLEWCPPGHGDLYTALFGSGQLDELLSKGIKYMFVSNSDNLGATMDLELLSFFAENNYPFMMECCQRTEADKKGGHLALRKSDQQMLLRESAQCSDADEKMFQDVTRHQYFNTNNLWVRLDMLKDLMAKTGGFVALPTILNSKTVDPQQGDSTPVYQLETAMGAAIECFKGSSAVVVPRSRFAPVKKCSDLLLLRSDAYTINSDNVLVLRSECKGVAPIVDLDSKKYKLVQHLEAATRGGFPSLIGAKKFKVTGEVHLTSGVIIKGNVTVTNSSDEAKTLPPGVYEDTTVDLSSAPGLGPLACSTVKVVPFGDQKPGTSGLRKKTKVFMGENYLENFVQATFNALATNGTDVTAADGALLVGGDGRYYNDVAIQTIVKMAAANGVKRVIIGQKGLLSTPAVSAIIRERGPRWKTCFGAFILTASHNPGGPEEDFGIKYNCENGGPAPERLTNAIYDNTKVITSYKVCKSFPTVDINTVGETVVAAKDDFSQVSVEVISATDAHLNLLETVFDFGSIEKLCRREDFSIRYDCMSGVQGPYAHKVFIERLGLPAESLLNAEPKEDFGGGHADPNLTYARKLCAVMGVDKEGNAVETTDTPPCFGAAADGDADRNMILGRRFFCTPSDSLAVICAHADSIPFFKQQGGIRSVARSMPTSGAVDLVAKARNLHLFETPTGWKFFGNVMDSKTLFGGDEYNPMVCGEESFGTGSNHVREKDGLWAVLAWMQILASYNGNTHMPFVHIEDIVKSHWNTYGRNYYCRYDYEGVDKPKAEAVLAGIEAQFNALPGQKFGSYTVASSDQFTYVDPIDGSVSKKQGVRIIMADGSRVVFRLSGTAGSGATIRMYLEAYEQENISQKTKDALKELVGVALTISKIPEITGFSGPTVIT